MTKLTEPQKRALNIVKRTGFLTTTTLRRHGIKERTIEVLVEHGDLKCEHVHMPNPRDSYDKWTAA